MRAAAVSPTYNLPRVLRTLSREKNMSSHVFRVIYTDSVEFETFLEMMMVRPCT